MLRGLFFGTLVCGVGGLVAFCATPSAAQRVWVGGGGGGVRVRAPFVRVDVDPYGGVSVRAPFAAIDVPPDDYYYGSNYPPPAYVERRVVEPRFPSPVDFAAMDDEQLNLALRDIAQSLHNRLNRFDTGITWQRYLRLPEETIDPSTPPDAQVAAVATLLDKFQNVANDPQYSMIARLPAFTAMEAALNEALSRPNSDSTPSATPAEELPMPTTEQQDRLPPPERPMREGGNRRFLQPSTPR